MGYQTAAGGDLAARFGLRKLRIHTSSSLTSGGLAVTELLSDVATPGPTESRPPDDAIMVGYQLASSRHEMWFDGRPSPSPDFVPGETCFYDLRRDPRVLVKGPYHSLQFYLPFKAMNHFVAENGGNALRDIRYRLAQPENDPVIAHLALAIRPFFNEGEVVNALFVDHVLQAMCAHVVQRYGDVTLAGGPSRLTGWQERRVKERMRAALQDKLSVQDLAAECGLSVSHFARAFRITTGMPPHRWLMQVRIERARELIVGTSVPLSQIALDCGFSDQSHMTRLFSQFTGTCPASWRRTRLPADSANQ